MGAFEILDNISGYHEYDISDAQKLRFVSDSLCRMTGYSKNELTDSEYGYTGLLCEDDREKYQKVGWKYYFCEGFRECKAWEGRKAYRVFRGC